ncbi:MAG: DUF1501 domain-containing protein, partial [Planctomycetaceae bacterium]|nr:DUF1501 domain-containing protein [Planctomycetaceae bacterium]
MSHKSAFASIAGQLDASRRCFLQAGVLGTAGLSLATHRHLQAAGAAESSSRRSVILFWLSGGPGHMETWDPKPLAPSEYRGPLGAIATDLPDVQFGELMPRLSQMASQLAIVRTVRHGSGDHTKGNHWMLTGFEGPAFNAPDNRRQRRPAMGAAVSRIKGPNAPGMPAYVGVPHLRGGTDNLFHYAAYLGGRWNPFVVNSDPNEKDYTVRNLSVSGGLTLQRIAERRELASALDQLRSGSEPMLRDFDEYQLAAFELLTSDRAKQAFDVSQEAPTLRDHYGRHTFGQSALVARRLVEAGVTFVTVNCVPWDHHGSPGQYKTEEGARLLIPPLDQAIAALVTDLTDRGLYEETLIVAMGEFGRTPRMNANAGRDHWGNTFSVLFGGGGMKMGQVIGTSSRRGEHVVDRPVDPQDIAATVYHHLGIRSREVTFHDELSRPMPLIDTG